MKPYTFNFISDKFRFGKYSGWMLCEVLENNLEYVYWCIANIDSLYFSAYCIKEIKSLYPNVIISKSFYQHDICQKDGDYESENYTDEYDCCESNRWADENPTYEKYRGSYAQDEMGYSDDEIDTIFDGDPSAYWNID